MHRLPSTRKLSGASNAWPRPALLLLCAVLASCEKKPTEPDPVEITITPDNVVLFIGAAQQLTAVGAVGAVSWSSSNTQVATVVAQTGFVQAVGRGEATITATAAGSSAARVVTVLAPPALALSTPTLAFQNPLGAAAPAAQTVNVTNSGDGSINNLVVGSISYGAGQPTGWLTATLSGASVPAVVTVRVNGAGLARGTYTAIVPIQASGLANSPQNIGVTFRVLGPPSIVLSRNAVSMAGIPGDIRTEVVNVTNGGDLPLTDLTRTITYTAGQAGWLQANLAGTTAPTTLTLIGTVGTLAAGTYTANVQVASGVAGVAAQTVAVTLVVSPGPAIQLTPPTVVVNVANGAVAPPQTVAVSNSGGGTLSGLSIGTITYGGGQTTGWLTATLNTTTAPATVTLTFNSAPLAGGIYNATVPVLSAVASNSPQNIPVTLSVGPPPQLAINPNTANFATWGGAASLPPAQPIQVTNSGGGTLGNLTVSISYGSGSGWLTATFQGGTTAPTTVLLRPSTTALAAGTYTATVTIGSTQAGITPRTVSVTYTVQTFTVQVYPRLTSSCSGCHLHFSGTSSQVYTATQSNGRVVPFNATASPLVCKPFNVSATCNLTHGGGKFSDPAMLAAFMNWINAGAPFQ